MPFSIEEFNRADNFFTTEEQGPISILKFKEKQGLFGESLGHMDLLWKYLEKVEKYKKKVLIILLPIDFLSPRDMDEFWCLLENQKDGHSVQPAISNTIAEWDLIRKENAFHHFSSIVRNMQTMVICAFQGTAFFSFLGVPLVCDYRIVSRGSEFTCRCLEAGLPPGGAFPWFLARYIGHGQTSKILYEETTLTAERMHEMGLVHQVAEPGQLENITRQKAEWFASLPPNGLISAKRMLNATHLRLEEYLDREERELERCLHSKS